MAWESPLDEMLHPGPTLKSSFIGVCEWAYLGIFTFELLTKVLAYGFIRNREAYLRDAWCQLDFVVVTLAWAPIFFPNMGSGASVIRAVRALRPLRALKRMPGMPKLVGSMLTSIPKLADVLALCAFIFLVFGIAGVELFKGAMHYRCVAMTENGLGEHDATITANIGEDTGVFCVAGAGTCAQGTSCTYLANPTVDKGNFDNIGSAAMVILQAATFDGWTRGMYVMMEIVASYVWVYYFLIVCIGGFFVVNLFLAVLLQEFLNGQQAEDAEAAASDAAVGLAEQAAAESLRAAQNLAGAAEGALKGSMQIAIDGAAGVADRASGHAAKKADDATDATGAKGLSLLGRFVTSDRFGHASTGLVIINLVVMCCPYAGMTTEYEAKLENIGTVITVIFMAEMALKLLGVGCAGYWRDTWNRLDGTIVIISGFDLGMTIAFAGGGPNISFLRILRMLRVLRMLRLMKSWKGLYKICMTLAKAIPQVGNVLVLFALITLIFALLGMTLFGGSFGSYVETPVDLPRTHYDYIGPAMLTTFVVMSGSWFDIMMAQAEVAPVAPTFFISLLVVGLFLLLNIFITVLLEAFADDDEEEGDTEAIEAEAKPTGCAASDRALCLFAPANPARRLCHRIIESKHFDRFIIFLIVTSSICLALDSPRIDPASSLGVGLVLANKIFTLLFTCECILKVIALGFACHKGAYIRDPWNVLDFFIVNVSLVCLFAEMFPALRPLKSLRILRVLRPLRLLARDPGMRLIIELLFKVMPSVSNVFGVMLAIQTVFAILGLQLFSGSFGSCTDPSITLASECVEADAEAGAAAVARRMLKGGASHGSHAGQGTVWLNPAFGSFDSFGSAMLLLYIMSTGDGWEDVMYQGMDAVGPGIAPVRNDFSPSALFFIAWMFFGSFFAVNLFVGTICDNFSRIKKEGDGTATMTPEQQQWMLTMKQGSGSKAVRVPRAPTNKFRALLFKLVTSQPFDMCIMGVIMANVALMASDFWQIEQTDFGSVYTHGMTVFSYIYYVEATLKITALGLDYFRDNWCRFDFFLVCTTLLDQFGHELLEAVLPLPPMLLRVLRVLRILRVLRLLKSKRAKGLRDLLMTLVLSAPALVNISSLLALLMGMYAVLGVQLFTYVAHGDALLTDDRNFNNFGSALLLLFQVLTGDDWAAIMSDCRASPESSSCTVEEGNCGTAAAIPYFVSFQVLGSFVMLNLVVAVILENFTTLGNVNPNLISSNDIANFKEAWAEIDPDANGLAPISDLANVLNALPPPMGFKGGGGAWNTAKVRRYIESLKLTDHDGEVKFQEVIDKIVRDKEPKGMAEASTSGKASASSSS